LHLLFFRTEIADKIFIVYNLIPKLLVLEVTLQNFLEIFYPAVHVIHCQSLINLIENLTTSTFSQASLRVCN